LSELCLRLDAAALGAASTRIVECLAKRRSLFLAGNGGSAATAEHWANDLRCIADRAGWTPARVEALSVSSAQVTALANDQGYEHVFAHALRAGARAGDTLVVLSASGNSRNVLAALGEARRRGVNTIGLLGQGGGEALVLCDLALLVDSDDYGHIEDLHLACGHAVTQHIRRHHTPDGVAAQGTEA
jgi:D-sedoheptulose 7-phosphate isomerase